MILTGITDAMLDRALREESLLRGHAPPREALREMAVALHEHECAQFGYHDLGETEQQVWDRLTQAGREGHLQCSAWLLGRMYLAGFSVSRYEVRRLASEKP